MKGLNVYLAGIFLLTTGTHCLAEEPLPDYELGKKRIVFNSPENNPIKQALLPTHSNVNLLTGEFVENSCDFVVAGAEKISVNRFYNHLCIHDDNYGGWRYNPESFVVANFEWVDQQQFVSFGEHSGQINLFDQHDADSFLLSTEQMQSYCYFQNDDSTSNNHLLNTSVKYRKVGDPKNGTRFTWRGTITDGTGTMRTFNSEMHPWHSRVKPASHSKLFFTPNVWTPYMLLVTEERKPNGTYLKYGYENIHQNVYPQFGLLKSITAYNNTKTKVMGSLSFKYHFSSANKIDSFEVQGSDGRKVRFSHTNSDPVFLGSVKADGQPLTTFSYGRNFLTQVEKPDGRLLKNVYDPESQKLIAQYASVGDTQSLISEIARFIYEEKSTKVIDGSDNLVVYNFDTDKRLSRIEKYDGNNIYSIEHNTWDTKTGNLMQTSIEDGNGQIFKQHEYAYDDFHNVVEETLRDTNDSCTICRTFSQDGRNLKLSETDGMGRTTFYQYVPSTNLVAKQFVHNGDEIAKRIFKEYDDCAVCIKKIVDDGHSEDPNDLAAITYRKITCTQPKKTTPCMGLPEVVEVKTIDKGGEEIFISRVIYQYHPSGQILQENHYDSSGTFRYSIQNSYDNQERLIAQVDAQGGRVTFEYDDNNNLTALSGPRDDMRTTWVYDRANRPVREEVWVDNAQTLVTTKSYDNIGNLSSSTNPYGQTTSFSYDAFNRLTITTFPDGSSESKEYDILGNVIKEIDAKGYVTEKNYNFRGLVTHIYYPDESQESFAYFPNGSLYSHKERSGATTFYTYDTFNNPIKTTVRSRGGRVLKTEQANFSPFCKLSYIDPEGVTTDFHYDYAGTKVGETTKERNIFYQYDTFGRLAKTIAGDTVYVQEYDLLDHLIEKRTEDLSEKIYRKEQFCYDSTGNCTHTITCNGITERQYNALEQITLINEPGDLTTNIVYVYSDTLNKITSHPDGNQAEEFFDHKGQLLRKQVFNHNQETLSYEEKSYDGCGNLVEHLQDVYQGSERKNFQYKTTFDYGPMSRLEKKVENDQRVTAYAYDNNGRVMTLKKPDSTMLYYNYDDMGRLSRMYSSTKDIDYTYTYNHNDSFRSVQDRNHSATTSRRYDSYGNLTEEILPNNFIFSSKYTPYGKRSTFQLPDGSKIQYTYKGDQMYEVIRKDNTYTYLERDLLGKPTHISLPLELKAISIERNNRGLWDSYQAEHLNITNNSYDVSGQLQACKITDSIGEVEIERAYDTLGYLTSDKEHTYTYNSLGVRTGIDDREFEVDEFCQISADGKKCFSYDANGNLTSDGERNYTYDSLDRLTSVALGKTMLKYSYDPFHRRLKKEVFQNKVLTDFHFTMWDDQEEIGSTVQTKWIVELRILGDSIDTASPLAVAHEFNEKTYIPFHDYQGSVLTVVDLETAEPAETYRYTGYGEELIVGTATPWRFANSRLDSEADLIYGNKVFYNPALGRHLTGKQSWPNPYHYVGK